MWDHEASNNIQNREREVTEVAFISALPCPLLGEGSLP